MAVQYNPGIVTDGLVLYLDAANRKSYPGTGTGYNDLSSQQSSARLVNGPIFKNDFNGIFSLDGTDDIIEVNNNVFYSYGTEITVSACVRFNAFKFILAQAQKEVDTMATNVWLWHETSNGFIWFINDNQTWRSATISSGLTTGVWYHITTTANSTNSKIYVNGVDTVTGSGITTQIVNNATSGIGTNDYRYSLTSGRSPHNGDINCIQVYNKSLSPQEIQQNFNALRGRFGI